MPYNIAVSFDPDVPPLDPLTVEALVTAALAAHGVPDGAAVSIVFTDDVTIHDLNREFRGIDRPTDVLSFGAGEGPEDAAFVLPPGTAVELGEVIVSHETAERQAAEHGRAVAHELAHLIMHGVLHLLGHDHAEPSDEAVMRAREDEVLLACGLPSGSAGWDHADSE